MNAGNRDFADDFRPDELSEFKEAFAMYEKVAPQKSKPKKRAGIYVPAALRPAPFGEPHAPTRILRFQVRLGKAARSSKMPDGSPTGICQVNMDTENTRIVERKEGEKGDRKYVHIAPDGTKVDYTAEDNALIAEADRTGGGAIRIADVHLPAAADVVERHRKDVEAERRSKRAQNEAEGARDPAKDLSRVIETKNLGTVLRALGFTPTQAEVDSMQDVKKPGVPKEINFPTLLAYIAEARPKTLREMDVIEAVKVFDKDGVGYIKTQEIQNMLVGRKGAYKSWGPKGDKKIMTEHEVKVLIAEADPSFFLDAAESPPGPGWVPYDFFVGMVKAL